ncbi:ABC transporter substrate-binding protein [Paracoccus contaminans]|uniref:ABC transporter substrate-binding protein n=1 Tax=Paracoccus contaminans TaxID=1945662 RepID=UPI00146D8B64|nr:ABC transporter substrate-binding protein [Paracoccus contaminans]
MTRAWLIAAAGALLSGPALAADGLVLQLRDSGPDGSAGYLAARDKGYYAAEGLDVTIRPGGPQAEPLDALATGAADLAVEGMAAALVAREKGLPVVNIAQPLNGTGLALVCWRRAGIGDLRSGLAGQTIGVRFAADRHAFIAWMNRIGVPTDGGEQGANLIEQGAGLETLRAKRAACVTATAPVGGQQPEAGPDFVTFHDDGAMPGDGLYALGTALADPAGESRLVRFVRASMRGWAEIARQPETAGGPQQRMGPACCGPQVNVPDGRLDIAAAGRAVQALLAGPHPLLSAPPVGAWTEAITDRAAQPGAAGALPAGAQAAGRPQDGAALRKAP